MTMMTIIHHLCQHLIAGCNFARWNRNLFTADTSLCFIILIVTHFTAGSVMKYFMYGFSTQYFTVSMYHIAGKFGREKIGKFTLFKYLAKKLANEQISQEVIFVSTNLDGFQFGNLQAICQIYQTFLPPSFSHYMVCMVELANNDAPVSIQSDPVSIPWI